MNEKETFLFMADGHVRGRTWTNSMVLQGDAYAALQHLSAASTLADTLVIGGDWFDSNRPSSRDVDESLACLRRFARVYYIKGNHDSAEPAWLGGILPSARHLTTTPEALFSGVYICGVDWLPRREDMLAALTEACGNAAGLEGCRRLYVVLHDALKETLAFDGTYLCTVKELCSAFGDLPFPVGFLVGHVHRRKVLEMGDDIVLSPGPLYPDAVDRMRESCGAFLLYADGRKPEIASTNVRMYVSADYTDDAALAELCRDCVRKSSVRGYVLPPAVMLHVGGDSDVAVHPPKDSGVVVHIVRDTAQAGTSQPERQFTASSQGMLDAIQEAASYDNTIRDMAVALYECDDPLAEIDKWLTHWGAVRS